MVQKEVRLQLRVLAYNLGIFLNSADPPNEIATWSLTSLQIKLIKIGARVIRHARTTTFHLAKVAISGQLFHQFLAAIHNRRPAPAPT